MPQRYIQFSTDMPLKVSSVFHTPNVASRHEGVEVYRHKLLTSALDGNGHCFLPISLHQKKQPLVKTGSEPEGFRTGVKR